MKVKHQDIDIVSEEPFKNCKLGREKYAKVLTDIVNVYSEGFVLAINNEWGTGKTTFVKMWQQSLVNDGFKTIYFNAWENDFDSNPLVSIISELETLINTRNQKSFKNVVKKGASLVKNVLPAVLGSVAKKYVDTETLLNAIKNTAESATEIFEEEIKNYANKKKSIVDFRSELERFISKEESEKPLVFIIDELDRCRPTYAVEVLEQMKHFFSVSGIVFVLSIDKNHLAASVRGFYGSENINTDEYLRRFIDLEYSIPAPSTKIFCEYLYSYYSFEEFFSSTERIKHGSFQSDREEFLKMATLLFSRTGATLRQQEKIFSLSRLALKGFDESTYVFPFILFFLVALRILKSDLYKKIESQSLTLQDVSDVFSDVMSGNIEDHKGVNLIYCQAILLYLYNNSYEFRLRKNLYVRDNNNRPVSSIISKLENEAAEPELPQYLVTVSNRDFYDISLMYLLNKISLIEAFKN